jgi:hypothetical protein
MGRLSENSQTDDLLPLSAQEALAVGVLALNAPHWVRQFTGVGREDFVPSDPDATLVTRAPKSTRRRRTQKVRHAALPSGNSQPSELPQDAVFAERCFLSLLDLPATSAADGPGNTVLEKAWVWAKATAVLSTFALAAKAVASRLPRRVAPRPQPAAPRYTGPTLLHQPPGFP